MRLARAAWRIRPRGKREATLRIATSFRTPFKAKIKTKNQNRKGETELDLKGKVSTKNVEN